MGKGWEVIFSSSRATWSKDHRNSREVHFLELQTARAFSTFGFMGLTAVPWRHVTVVTVSCHRHVVVVPQPRLAEALRPDELIRLEKLCPEMAGFSHGFAMVCQVSVMSAMAVSLVPSKLR